MVLLLSERPVAGGILDRFRPQEDSYKEKLKKFEDCMKRKSIIVSKRMDEAIRTTFDDGAFKVFLVDY
jgi:hypothetical protein